MVENIRVKVISYIEKGPRIIASAGKVSLSRRTIDPKRMDQNEIKRWIKELIKRGHGSPLEHSSYTFSIEGCSRVCSHQLVRHRLASYTQQSMRYSEGYLRAQALKVAEIIGKSCPKSPKEAGVKAYRCYSEVLRNSLDFLNSAQLLDTARIAYVIPDNIKFKDLTSYLKELLRATSLYYELLSRNVNKEDARYVIPQAVRTNLVVTMNARELLESFLPLRMCTRAQAEIRRVAWLIWVELMKIHPELFKWAGPRCVYLENKTRLEPCTLKEFIEGKCDFTIKRCPELVPREGIKECLRFATRTINKKDVIL